MREVCVIVGMALCIFCGSVVGYNAGYDQGYERGYIEGGTWVYEQWEEVFQDFIDTHRQ